MMAAKGEAVLALLAVLSASERSAAANNRAKCNCSRCNAQTPPYCSSTSSCVNHMLRHCSHTCAVSPACRNGVQHGCQQQCERRAGKHEVHLAHWLAVACAAAAAMGQLWHRPGNTRCAMCRRHRLPLCIYAAVKGYIKLALDAGKANPAPPVGPALGAKVTLQQAVAQPAAMHDRAAGRADLWANHTGDQLRCAAGVNRLNAANVQCCLVGH